MLPNDYIFNVFMYITHKIRHMYYIVVMMQQVSSALVSTPSPTPLF